MARGAVRPKMSPMSIFEGLMLSGSDQLKPCVSWATARSSAYRPSAIPGHDRRPDLNGRNSKHPPLKSSPAASPLGTNHDGQNASASFHEPRWWPMDQTLTMTQEPLGTEYPATTQSSAVSWRSSGISGCSRSVSLMTHLRKGSLSRSDSLTLRSSPMMSASSCCTRRRSSGLCIISAMAHSFQLQSSDISKDKQVDPALADTLKLSFTRSEFSMAFPYVSTTVDERLEDSLLSSFAENCNNGFGRNRITYTDTCTGQDLKKYHNMDAINDLVVSGVASRRVNHPSGQTDVIVFCSGGFENPGTAKSEGELLSQLVDLLDLSGAKYTVLYASQPSGLLESPSGLPLGRHLAEKKTNGTKAAQGEKEKCDGECLVKSSLLEGTFVGIVLLIILISGLMCMMGIDTPSRFEAPQES